MDIMEINPLQQIGLAGAVLAVLANSVYMRNSKDCKEPGGCYGVFMFGAGFLMWLGVLLLASMYELVFSNRKQGLHGIALMVVTILVTMNTTKLQGFRS
jgi:Na+-transporting NADH:ubiquinone oxidoreductase subunit NqrE